MPQDNTEDTGGNPTKLVQKPEISTGNTEEDKRRSRKYSENVGPSPISASQDLSLPKVVPLETPPTQRPKHEGGTATDSANGDSPRLEFEDATEVQEPVSPLDQPAPSEIKPNTLERIDTYRSRHRSVSHVSQDSPSKSRPKSQSGSPADVRHSATGNKGFVSEWSHQQLAPQEESDEEESEAKWQQMPAYADWDIYDDDNRLVAKQHDDNEDLMDIYTGKGGAAKGYTKVQMDDDVQSATSMDEDTAYLFKEPMSNALQDDDEEVRDQNAQMQATKDLLTENQRIAYVGVVRLAAAEMIRDISTVEKTRGSKKQVELAIEGMKMWTQKVMVRLYSHMELATAEQVMIEQLAEHGLQPGDLTPSLMQDAKVKNPAAEKDSPENDASTQQEDKEIETKKTNGDASSETKDDHEEKAATEGEDEKSPSPKQGPGSPDFDDKDNDDPPPPYDPTDNSKLDHARTTSDLEGSKTLNIDLRWTILCDLFLVLISDAVYDSRSRCMLERVGAFLQVPWLDICRFEKRITDALEMQEQAEKENWDEMEHMETRRKRAQRKRIMMMGLATVGGGLVIGLSAGALAPLIGAGLAAGFTTIGVTGTGAFLGGAGGAAIIGTTGILTGGAVGVRAANRRTGAVKTFEYRPLHNNKRVNLIVTVAGWMTGKVDDVRLPFSTVDPIMGDMYSVHWEPEMLRSVGDTINILATEALTQGLQQLLGSTILIPLMAAMQIPLVLSKLSYLIDNPWTVSVARADLAGLILADSLVDRNLGARPVTLVGFSLGARVIFAALKELAAKGALGVVQNVYLFGAPVVVKKDEWLKIRSIVPGRIVSGYATNDWILAYLFRATGGGIAKVAGLAKLDIPGIEDVELTDIVAGHMAYRRAMPRVLRRVGWTITSDEFAEIEDPDPDNHEARQRELINEIEEARKEAEAKPQKKKWGFFKMQRSTKKKEWETYDDKIKQGGAEEDTEATAQGNAMFDVDAILKETAELAAEGLEIKELDTTVGPLKIDTASPPTPSGAFMERPSLEMRQTKSHDASRLGTPKLDEQQTSKSMDLHDPTSHSHSESGDISLTFDTSFREDPLASLPSRESSLPVRPAAQGRHTSPLPSQVPSETKSTPAEEHQMNTEHDHHTAAQPSHDVWADEDEFGHGEEEVSMTFE